MDFRSFFLLYSFELIRLYMYITIIAAVAQNMAIGNNNQLLYWSCKYLPDGIFGGPIDLKLASFRINL